MPSAPPERLSRKRQATRQSISDAATRLFWERGFDRVTVDEIAQAAEVGRMTVFNHFARKEDMFFDREEQGRETLRQALRERDPRVSMVEALRRLAHRLVAERSPYISFTAEGQSFIATIAGSETLKARARAIRDELAELVAEALCECAARPSADPAAHLAGSLLLASWSVAFIEAHALFRRDGDAARAEALFLAIVDKGALALEAALAGTPYV
jgi:AcrR family transcriptional regulator